MKLLCTLVCVGLLCSTASGQIFSKKYSTKAFDRDYPRSLETKFDLDGGLIFIEPGEENQGMKNFLLDTGAPTLILNQVVPEKGAGFRVVGVNGSCPMIFKKLKNFHLQVMTIGKVRSYATDLGSLERVKDKKIDGILGYQVLKSFELFIDYERRYLMLFEPGASDLHALIKPVGEIKFKLRNHFPIVKVKIGKRYYYFGIDTGAEVNVINKRLEEKVCKKLNIKKIGSKVHGLNGSSMNVRAGVIPRISIEDEVFNNQPFVFANLSAINASTGFELDGILGYPFLSSGKFSINYKEHTLYQWDDPLGEANALERLSLLEEN